MKRLLLYSLILFTSCNSEKQTKDIITDDVKQSETIEGNDRQVAAITPGCYLMVIGKDSALMNLEVNGSAVSGKLEYNRFEKDDNKGNFSGTVDSNRIVAWYNFQSEGMASVRQVIFRINGDKLQEAYGDLEMNGDTASFKFPHAVSYEEKHPYIKTDCR